MSLTQHPEFSKFLMWCASNLEETMCDTQHPWNVARQEPECEWLRHELIKTGLMRTETWWAANIQDKADASLHTVAMFNVPYSYSDDGFIVLSLMHDGQFRIRTDNFISDIAFVENYPNLGAYETLDDAIDVCMLLFTHD